MFAEHFCSGNFTVVMRKKNRTHYTYAYVALAQRIRVMCLIDWRPPNPTDEISEEIFAFLNKFLTVCGGKMH